MQPAQPTAATVTVPFPSVWGVHASIGGRPVVWGTFNINSVTGNTLNGAVNFRGTPIPINGFWDENSKQITFDSPYASFTGVLNIYDDPTIRIRHFTLSGRIVMKRPSLQAGEFGTWIASTSTPLVGAPISNPSLPPVGVFLTSDILNQMR